jgi:hypothetical protein
MKVLVLFFLTTAVVSCTKPASFTNTRWNGDGTIPMAPHGVDPSAAKISVGSKQELDFQFQSITGVQVEDAFYKSLSNSSGPQFITYNWISEIPFSVKADLLAMRAERFFVLSRFLKMYPNYKALVAYGEPELVIRTKNYHQVLWKLIFQQNDGVLMAVYIDRSWRMMDRKIVGSQFVDGTGALFPDGPLKSDIQQVILKNLLGNQTLTSDKVKVGTQSTEVAVSENNQFLYPLEDNRFGQVQTFFYLSQSIDWFKNNLSFTLPFVLQAETSMGYPDKTNSAFYYQHKIRLGDGDGQTYDKIPLDPSIVTHESIHAIVEAVARLPYENEGGSINEGFADYFTATQLQNPHLGEASYKLGPFKRTVDGALSFADRSGGLYHDSAVVSGLFWQFRKELGSDVANKIAWSVLLRLNPLTDFNSLSVEVKDVISKQDVEVQDKANAILKQRGW